MKKRYEVRGMMEWHPVLRAGRGRVKVSFTGGHLAEGCVTPASFTTSDAVVQRVIENSQYFRTGRIRLGSQQADDEPPETPHKKGAPGKLVKKAEAPAAAPAGEATLFDMEFEDTIAASDYLRYKKGVEKTEFFTGQNCIDKAKELGINMKIKKLT